MTGGPVYLHKDIPLNGVGLFKARLLGATYICVAYRARWPQSKEDIFDFWSTGAGVAYGPFQKDPTYPAVSREVAAALSRRYMAGAGLAIIEEMVTGSSTVEHSSKCVNQLVDLTDEALIDSVGEEYNCDVFRILHVGRIITAINNAVLWFEKIK
jgi:hypothetical protein